MRLVFFVLLVAVVAGISLWWKAEYDQTTRFDGIITEAARKYEIDPHLVRAVIWRESAFDPDCLGKAKERGLMQVTPAAGKEWAQAEKRKKFRAEDLLNPRTNIYAGTWYLARARKRWDHTDEPETFALAEYNAGRSQALRWARELNPPASAAFFHRIDFPTTKAYIVDIMERYQLYREDNAPGPFGMLWEKILRKAKKFFAATQKAKKSQRK